MNRNDNPRESEKIMGGFYHYIGQHHVDQTAKELDSIREAAREIEYPKELDAWFKVYMKDIKKSERKKRWARQFKTSTQAVAATLLIVIITLIVTSVTIEAFRVRIFNFIMDVSKNYTNVQIKETNPALNSITDQIQWDTYYLPEYIPNGYKLFDRKELGSNKILYFRTEDNLEIQFSQSKNGGNFQIDTEEAETADVTVNGVEGILIEKNGLRTLLWHNNDYTFYIIGKLSEHDLLTMAESVKKEK